MDQQPNLEPPSGRRGGQLAGRRNRMLRGGLFMTWMLALGSVYLLLIVALLAGNISYMQQEAQDNLRKERRQASASSQPATAAEAEPPITSIDQARAWAAFLKKTIVNKQVWSATRLSFVTSTVTVILALLLGIPTAYILSRRRFWGLTVIDTILDIPIVLPPLVVGVSLLIFFQTPPGRWINHHFPGELVFRPAGIVLAQFAVACAFGIRMVKATFEQIDPRIEAVARTLGASKGQAFFRLTLPMSRDGILAAGVMTWARAIGEFGPILILVGTTRMQTEVLPTSVFLEFQVGNLQAALAVSMLMILISVVTLIVFKKVAGVKFV